MGNTFKVGLLKESLTIGGTERSAANISKVLESECDLYFLLYDGSDVKYNYSGQLIDIQLPPAKTKPGKVLNSFKRYAKVKKAIQQHSIDVLYEFIPIENMLSYVSYKNTKRVISARDYGKMARKTKFFHMALCRADAMICNSNYIKDYYISQYPEHKDKAFTVYNIIDIEEIARQAVEETEETYTVFLKNHSKTIAAVGRFCKEKGFTYLIEAFAKARKGNEDLGLVLVGDGDYKQQYMEKIRQFDLEKHVYFTGFQKNPYKYMAKCSCFVLSSLSEGFPNVLAEAMALGLPVIAANCRSGPAEILRKDCDYTAVTDAYQECDYGIITPEMTDGENQNAIKQLSLAIIALLGDPGKMNAYGSLAKKRASDFSKEATRTKLKEIFYKLQGRNLK